jgi:hypothetical protein
MFRAATTILPILSCAAILTVSTLVAGSAETTFGVPNFSTSTVSWRGSNGMEFLPVDGSPPAVGRHPNHPRITNAISRRTGQQPTSHIPDLSNPNLMQWAKDIMQVDSDEVLEGKIPYMPSQSCKPWGTPAVMQSGGPFIIYQTPTEVIVVEESERLARHIYLNVPHSTNLKPSYYGESVGHYEGDTLVVDTIGFNAETFVDFFRTPHTEQMHVIERWRLIDNGEQLEILFTVDDPGTYHLPWQVMRRLGFSDAPLGENICREGSFQIHDFGVPIEEAPDF